MIPSSSSLSSLVDVSIFVKGDERRDGGACTQKDPMLKVWIYSMAEKHELGQRVGYEVRDFFVC